MSAEQQESALKAANVAMSGRQHRAANRFASIELRAVDRNQSAWEVAAVGCVMLASLLLVAGVWFM